MNRAGLILPTGNCVSGCFCRTHEFLLKRQFFRLSSLWTVPARLHYQPAAGRKFMRNRLLSAADWKSCRSAQHGGTPLPAGMDRFRQTGSFCRPGPWGSGSNIGRPNEGRVTVAGTRSGFLTPHPGHRSDPQLIVDSGSIEQRMRKSGNPAGIRRAAQKFLFSSAAPPDDPTS